jgi:hypothetical protein
MTNCLPCLGTDEMAQFSSGFVVVCALFGFGCLVDHTFITIFLLLYSFTRAYRSTTLHSANERLQG